jgi:hypothetical protein
MNKDFAALIDESIKLELLVADLYLLFQKLFPRDADFWWKLVLEEKGHAALIRSGKEIFEPLGKFPHGLLPPVLQQLIEINSRLDSLIKQYKTTPPTREEAFNLAFATENSAGEMHFQEFMEKNLDSDVDRIFKQLNKDDKDHAARIKSYMERQGIQLHNPATE